MKAAKGGKDPRPVPGRDADPVVLDPEGPMPALGGSTDMYAGSLSAAVLDRVTDQVLKQQNE
jgi:hypothetical protein